jgi:predicted chitinase|tara:strand:- start:5281 stop:5997 length:717 start_codon:yes stop_codon:yes gene_type:complete
MPVKFNINNAIELFNRTGGETKFDNSLKQVLKFMQNDTNLNNEKEVAYFLATAKSESDYSLQRWEADYLCGEKGIAYKGKPCKKALDYYRSDNGKSNYFKKGVDKNGMAYFGRGLIQLTHNYNYKRYGDLIGVDLVNNGDLALVPQNSYKVASEFLNRKTFKLVNKGDLTKARKSVNGGTKGVDRTNKEYNRWLSILSNPLVKFERIFWTKKKRIIYGSVLLGSILIGGYIIYKAFNK